MPRRLEPEVAKCPTEVNTEVGHRLVRPTSSVVRKEIIGSGKASPVAAKMPRLKETVLSSDEGSSKYHPELHAGKIPQVYAGKDVKMLAAREAAAASSPRKSSKGVPGEELADGNAGNSLSRKAMRIASACIGGGGTTGGGERSDKDSRGVGVDRRRESGGTNRIFKKAFDEALRPCSFRPGADKVSSFSL